MLSMAPLNPKVVLCLGKEVMRSLSKKDKITFKSFTFENNKIETNDKFWGNRKFIASNILQWQIQTGNLLTNM